MTEYPESPLWLFPKLVQFRGDRIVFPPYDVRTTGNSLEK
jgi:hypothetical protein